jgi:hypothetical protein
MTSIGKTAADVASGTSNLLRQSEARQSQQGQVARGRHDRPADAVYKQTRFSGEPQFDLSMSTDGEEAKFLKSFNAAVKRDAGDGKDDAGPDAQGSTGDERVIAIAERLNWTGLPLAATAQQTTATQPDVASLVDTITKLIARSISADAAPKAGQAAQFRFALPEGTPGLSHIQIVMTSSTLDVVLERSSAASGDKLAAAANTLADRLLTRFSKRSVRIIERLIDDPKDISAEEVEASERRAPLLRS